MKIITRSAKRWRVRDAARTTVGDRTSKANGKLSEETRIDQVDCSFASGHVSPIEYNVLCRFHGHELHIIHRWLTDLSASLMTSRSERKGFLLCSNTRNILEHGGRMTRTHTSSSTYASWLIRFSSTRHSVWVISSCLANYQTVENMKNINDKRSSSAIFFTSPKFYIKIGLKLHVQSSLVNILDTRINPRNTKVLYDIFYRRSVKDPYALQQIL